MKYIRPGYIDELADTFKDYFNEENFKDKPYPRTLENANDYLLYNVFKVDTTENIVVFSLNKNGGLEEKSSEYNRKNFHKVFNYNIWKNLQDAGRITALYWLYEEICEDLQIFKPKFIFLQPQNKNYAGYYRPNTHSLHIILNMDEYETAYTYIDTIAHELKHAEFFSKEPTRYLDKLNYNYYFDAPQEKDYNLEDDKEKFEYNYDLACYYQQPNEVESYNYGLKTAKEIFRQNNYKIKNGKLTNELKDSASLQDLNYFRNSNMDRRELNKVFEFVFQDNFKEHMDKHFLLNEFLSDVEVYAEEIMNLDPEVKQKGDKLISELDTEEMKMLIAEYEEALKNYYLMDKEIKKDKKELFKKYKQLLADENVVEYRT